MIEISKELWLEVIKPKIKDEVLKDGVIEHFEIVDNTLNVCMFYESKDIDCKGNGLHSPYNINIYELAHKCKEWALSKGYYLHSHIKEDNECWCIVKSLDNITRQFSCEMDTESEAIIKACEWILKEIKK